MDGVVECVCVGFLFEEEAVGGGGRGDVADEGFGEFREDCGVDGVVWGEGGEV